MVNKIEVIQSITDIQLSDVFEVIKDSQPQNN